MAAWQFDLQLVPRASLAQLGIAPDDHLSTEQLDNADWWRGKWLPADYATRVTAILPPASAWAQDWQVYGSEDGNRIDILATGGSIEEVRARIDARAMNVWFLERLVELAGNFDALFVSPESRVIEPDVEAIWVELELSPAARFVRNPEEFLEHLKRRR